MTKITLEQFQGIEPKTNGATPPPPSSDLSVFDDLDKLRIVDPAALSGDIAHLAHVAVRKPKKDEYFRVNPDPEMSLTSLVWADPDLGDVYFVTPDARPIMAESGRVVTLVLCQSRQRLLRQSVLPVAIAAGGPGARNLRARLNLFLF